MGCNSWLRGLRRSLMPSIAVGVSPRRERLCCCRRTGNRWTVLGWLGRGWPGRRRLLVVGWFTFADEGDGADLAATLRSAGVANVASSLDFEGQVLDVDQARAGDAVVFAELGVAVVSVDPSRVSAMQSAAGPAIVAVEPEYVHHVLEGSGRK
jgi:hypothetical protein